MKKNVDRTSSSSTSGRRGLAAVLAVIILSSVGLIWALMHPNQTEETRRLPIADPTATARTVPETVESPSRQPKPAVVTQCRRQATKPFEPETVELLGIGRYKALGLDLVHTEQGTMLPIPPDDIPDMFVWVTTDRAAKDQSMVRLTAHTWNDGEALGDIINERVPIGAVIILHGSSPSQKACYRVRDRQKVTVEEPTPKQAARADQVLGRYNGINPTDDLGIMVCSKRIAPGKYRDRMNVFATRYGA